MRRWKDNRTNDGRKSYTNYIGQTGREDGNERKEEHQEGDVQFCDRFRRGLEAYGGKTAELEMWSRADILSVAERLGVVYNDVLMTGECLASGVAPDYIRAAQA